MLDVYAANPPESRGRLRTFLAEPVESAPTGFNPGSRTNPLAGSCPSIVRRQVASPLPSRVPQGQDESDLRCPGNVGMPKDVEPTARRKVTPMSYRACLSDANLSECGDETDLRIDCGPRPGGRVGHGCWQGYWPGSPQSNLKAGVAKVDITPPPDTPVTGHPRKTSGVRDPIRAGILLSTTARPRRRSSRFDLIGASDALVGYRPRGGLLEGRASRARTSWSRPRTTTRARISRSKWPGRRRSSGKVAAAAAEAAAGHAAGDRRLRRGRDRLQHQPPQGHRRPGGRPAQPRRPVRPPGQGAPVRRRQVP